MTTIVGLWKAFFGTLLEMFGYAFLVRAFVVGALVSVCAALLGVSLVLKRYSMIGDGLSHVGFGALAASTALNMAPLAVSIPVVVAAAFLLLRLNEKRLIKGDAAIALFSTSSLAVGVVIISQTTGMNTDVCNYLFGSILAMNKNDVYLSVALSVTVLTLFAACYHKIFAVTFDETFARTAGVRVGFYNMLIAFLTAITIVLGMRMMGAMLISALIIFPALTSMRVFKTFGSVTVSAVVISAVCYFAGITLSYVYAIPAGASVVLVNLAAFALFHAASVLRGAANGGVSRGSAKGGAVNGGANGGAVNGATNAAATKRAAKAAAASLACLALLSACGSRASPTRIAQAAREAQTVSAAPAAQTAPATQAATAAQITPGQTAVISFGAAPETPAAPVAAVPAAAAAAVVPAGPVVEIKEKMFIAQTNDVYLNAEDYLGRVIKLQGLFKREQYGGGEYCYVLRYGPGCCGTDGNAGFEVAWEPPVPEPVVPEPAAASAAYPEVDDWVEATGVLKSYEEDGWPYLYLALTSLTVLDTRGAEFVTQ